MDHADADTPESAVLARLASLRHAGLPQREPVRWCQLEAMARRGQALQGLARRRLFERLAQRLASLPDQGLADAPGLAPSIAPPSPLALLLQDLRASQPPAGELKTLQAHRGTWSRLRVAQRLTRARSTVPPQAGPLNTQRLLHQALTLLQDHAPDYLQHFMQQVDTLLWLDLARLPTAAPRRPGRGKRVR